MLLIKRNAGKCRIVTARSNWRCNSLRNRPEIGFSVLALEGSLSYPRYHSVEVMLTLHPLQTSPETVLDRFNSRANNLILSGLRFVRVALESSWATQQLPRIAEPHLVMRDKECVNDFDEIFKTNVSVSLVGLLQLISDYGGLAMKGNAIDVACGPGHFTQLLAMHGQFDAVTGVDLSEPMLNKARIRCGDSLTQRATLRFERADATDLGMFPDNHFKLAVCSNSAHHMPDSNHLNSLISEMDRVTAGDGLVVIMDLVRPKNERLLETYWRLFGAEYARDGHVALLSDFRNSLIASWTMSELRRAVPKRGAVNWRHLGLKPIAVNQFLVRGLDHSRHFESGDGFSDSLLPKYRKQYASYARLGRSCVHC